MKNFLDLKIFGRSIPIFLVFFALALRLYGINWDQNQHLHPDERFLTMTVEKMVLPTSISKYLNPAESKLNPYNIGVNFFVYGTLPSTIVRYVAEYKIFDNFQYTNITLTGRLFSALFDTGTVVLIFQISKQLYNRKKALLSAFLYSISVLPIQLSHFFAVDTFLNFFLVLSFLFLVKFIAKRKTLHVFFLGLSFGAAIACKISAIYFLPVIFVLFLLDFLKYRKFFTTLFFVMITLFATILSVRILDPHIFSDDYVGLKLSPIFIQNIRELQMMSGKDTLFPPSIQWHNITPIVFPFKNIILWGLGLPLGILSILAVLHSIYNFFLVILKECKRPKNLPFFRWLRSFAIAQDDKKNDRTNLHNYITVKQPANIVMQNLAGGFSRFLILFWILFIFFYQAVQPTPSIRYFLPIYPFLAILSANFTVSHIFPLFKKSRLLLAIYYLLILVWPISFLSIYSRPHSRVTASEWIYQNIPEGSTISCDLWDDCLPLTTSDENNPYKYKILTLEPFAQDSEDKIQKFKASLKQIDYLILSSNRAWGSIPNVPEKYPYTSGFYKNLFENKLNFVKIAEFSSYPTIPLTFISIPDNDAEEAFTVYDHPEVLIFKKNITFSGE